MFIILLIILHVTAFLTGTLKGLMCVELIAILASCAASAFAKAQLPSIEADALRSPEILPEATGKPGPDSQNQRVHTAGEHPLSRPLSKSIQ